MNLLFLVGAFVFLAQDVRSSQVSADAVGRDKERIHRLRMEIEGYSSDLGEPEILHVGIELTRELLDELETTRYRQRVYLSLGDMSKRVGDKAAAMQYYEAGLKLDDDGRYATSLRIKLAALMREAGRFDDAKDLLKSPAEVVSVSLPGTQNLPVNQQSLFELRDHAKSAALAGDIDEAINDFKIGLDRYPSHAKELAGFATIVAESLSTHSTAVSRRSGGGRVLGVAEGSF